ncbi:hypothetical protein, partial [Candidatus Albibeggiatoa sp. nov. BB20]|uniref:hypothetical protein n=1 Tax=Candidatus Albibeggiatoa sp. nov. BB20 TaxID=3162723 RepID=UPI0033655E3E
MFAHRIETVISQQGSLNLEALPFLKGDEVEVIILKKSTQNKVEDLEQFFTQYQADLSGFA